MARNISTIYINASLQKIWDTLTKPELVKQWQYGSDLITDWKVGNQIRFRTEWEGNIFEQWGKILEIQPNKILRYSLFAPRPGLDDKPENYFEMIYSLTSEINGVKLEIIQIDNRAGAAQEEARDENNPILSSLKEIAERE